ncbi:MAG: N-acetylmuramoyl-L-alanine amidase [Acidobacteria bacterium]|nr:N-acetylmuramoyl-L-alanine amidase [Acidobacteriota bacterium]
MLIRPLTSALLAAGVLLAGVAAARTQAPAPYRVVATDATRTLPIARLSGSTDMVALDVLVQFFGLTMREDARTGGVVVSVQSQRVVLTAGQATVASGRRLMSLSAPVVKEGTTWLVPIDFLRVLDPLLGRRSEIRRASRLIVLGDATVPRLTLRVERTAAGGRLIVGVEPETATRVTRAGNQVTIRFQATALDVESLAEAPTDLLTAVRADGPTLLVDLGPTVSNVRQDDPRNESRVTLDLIGEPNATSIRRPPDFGASLPAPDLSNTVRTVVLDPGHGGSDVGRRSQDGLEEKSITLAVAQRLKAVLESRLGVRVLLTRDTDVEVAIDRRAALANNNKADVFISLHANGSPSQSLRGWQVQSLDPADYGGAPNPGSTPETASLSVPVVAGGTRLITAVPWHLAQIPHTRQSATLAQVMATHLSEAGLPSQPTPVVQAPLRVLVGANMPAVLIELGLLSNAQDAALLGDAQFQDTLAEILAAVIADARSDLFGRNR